MKKRLTTIAEWLVIAVLCVGSVALSLLLWVN